MGDLVVKVIVRTVLTYLFISLGVRLMGKRQIGDMQPTELVVTLLISEIAAIPLQDISQPISIGLMAIFMLVLLEITASVIILKSLRLRRVFSGKSVMLIKNGVIDQRAMKNVRLTVFDLIEMLRIEGIFDLAEVDCAILEVNGNLSVRQKAEFAPLTPTLAGMTSVEDRGICVTVISDGRVVASSLKQLGLTREALGLILKEKSLTAGEIFLMTLSCSGDAFIVKKE